MMSKVHSLTQAIMTSPAIEEGFCRLYGPGSVEHQKKRYLGLIERGRKCFKNASPFFISAPGRTELGGNHTDHNNGRVLASAVDLDCVALVAPVTDTTVTLSHDDSAHLTTVDLKTLTPRNNEKGTPEALIRGVAAGLQKHSVKIAGFNGFLNSTCLPGTGLSSSAAFSVLVGGVFSSLGKNQKFDPLKLAHVAGAAENHFFGKPCGLMDQMSSAVGGTISIDFKDPDNPVIVPVTESLNGFGYHLVIVDTGGSHADLTSQYAAIPKEIKQAIQIYQRETARGLDLKMVLERITEIRSEAGDRALLRLMHFIKEDIRAGRQADALRNSDFKEFLNLAKQSGRSSCSLLQNCSSTTDTRNQGILLALALTEELCPTSVSRVHGGGFAGTIQAYIPDNELKQYSNYMNSIFGTNAVIPVRTGRPGVCRLTENGWFFPALPE